MLWCSWRYILLKPACFLNQPVSRARLKGLTGHSSPSPGSGHQRRHLCSWVLFTGPEGPTLKHSLSTKPGTMQSGKRCSHGNHQARTHQSDCRIEKLGSSLQRDPKAVSGLDRWTSVLFLVFFPLISFYFSSVNLWYCFVIPILICPTRIPRRVPTSSRMTLTSVRETLLSL